MQVRSITVSVGITQSANYNSWRSDLTLGADLGPDEDVKTATSELYAQAEEVLKSEYALWMTKLQSK